MMGNVEEGKKGVVLKEGRDFITVVFHQAGLSSGWSFIGVRIMVVFHKAGLSSGWSFIRVRIRVVFHQASLSSCWSLMRVVFHQAGRLSGF